MILRKIFVTDIMSPGIVLVPPVLVPPVTESELGQFSVTNHHLAHPKGGLICKNVPDYPIYNDHSHSNF